MNLDSVIALDQRITLWLNSFNSPLSDSFWVFMSDTKIWFPAYGVVMGVMIWRLGWKRGLLMILTMILTVVAADQISAGVKDSVMRLRPCYTTWMLENGLHLPLPRYSLYGFFSSHASNVYSFAVVSLMGLNLDKSRRHCAYGWGVFLWASLVALSRIMVSAHYFGDVLVGTVFGLVIGLVFGLGARFLTRWV